MRRTIPGIMPKTGLVKHSEVRYNPVFDSKIEKKAAKGP